MRSSRPRATPSSARRRLAAAAISSADAALGSSTSPMPACSIAAAPANWSVDSGSSSSGTAGGQRLGDAVVAAVRSPRARSARGGAPAAGSRARATTPAALPAPHAGRNPVAKATRMSRRRKAFATRPSTSDARREEAAEADVGDRLVALVEPRLDLRVTRLGAHRRPEEGVRREQCRARSIVQLTGVVEQHQVARLGEGVEAGRGSRLRASRAPVPLGGEGVAHLDAQPVQRRRAPPGRARCARGKAGG